MTNPIVQLPDGQLIDREGFFAQRDGRTSLAAALPTTNVRIAVVLPEERANDHAAQLGFLWVASMLRRMGQAFASVVLVASENSRRTAYLGQMGSGEGASSLHDAVEIELTGADPFSDLEWRLPDHPGCFDGVAATICVGSATDATTPIDSIRISAHGWVAEVASGEPPLDVQLSCAPIAMIAAGALAVAQLYSRFVRGEVLQPLNFWWSVDSGEAATDARVARDWITRGSSEADPASWSTDNPVAIPRLVLVSAGGIGMNAAHLLAESSLDLSSVDVIDPDLVDISNLNRLIGVLLHHVGQSKAAIAANIFSRKTPTATSRDQAYESLPSSDSARNVTCEAGVVIVGVDQMVSRLHVQADWPRLLINGATGGLAFNASVHTPESSCVGCIYGEFKQSYAASRQAIACATGRGEMPAADIAASFPFVSVAAAAAVAAFAIAAVRSDSARLSAAGKRLTMNTTRPVFVGTKIGARSEKCSLLCSDSHLSHWLSQRGGAVA